MNKHILITGGAGFIGSNYIRRIIDGTLKGISHIKVVDKLTYAGNLNNFSKPERDNFEFIQADICDRQSIERILVGIDSIINLKEFTGFKLGSDIIYDCLSLINCDIYYVSVTNIAFITSFINEKNNGLHYN